MDIIDEKKLKSLHSSKTQRDKELERIKSLGVVSVLNKSFKETAPSPRPASVVPILSPSNSLTAIDNASTIDTFIINPISRPHSSSNPIKKSTSLSLHSDYTPNGSSSSGQQEPERELNKDNYLVANLSIDIEKETLEKRVQELEALYTASITELQILESRSNSQKDILMMQDTLIQQMSNQLDTQEITTSSMQCQVCSSDNVELLLEALTRELNALSPLTSEYSSALSDLTEEFIESDHRIEALEQVAQQIQNTNTVQTEFINTKVQTLLDKILVKDEIISKLEQQLQYQQLPLTPKPEMIHHSDSITSISDSSAVILENKEQDANHGRHSYTSRWKRNAIPPASPPPSSPLPPLPSASSCINNRPPSILSEISKASSIHAQHTSNKHKSMDAVSGGGGGGGGLLSMGPSEFDQELADAAYYKEFTNQLQERLSTSKEIDDLRVWGPADYDNLDKKMGVNRNWSDSDDGHSVSSQKAAFWKGMKKKLRV